MKSPRKKQKSPSLIVIVAIAIIAFAGLFALYKNFVPEKKAITPPRELSWETKGPENIAQEDSKPLEAEPPSTEVTIPSPPPTETPDSNHSCQHISTELNTFLNQLSSQEYIKAYEIDESLQRYLNTIIIKLLNNPPLITNESDNMFTILKNSAHFYRILGPKDISLLKDILAYESESMENFFASLYSWSSHRPPCQDDVLNFTFPLPKTYEYAAFFFKTVEGQSYLFRRESRIRTLIEYYSVLILNRADQMGSNKYNVDIDAAFATVKKEIQQTGYLIYKKQYLKTIDTLRGQ